MHRFHLKAKTGNKKIGDMAVITSTRSTCPNNCEFCGNNGCYAEYHHMRHWWDQLEANNVGTNFNGLLKDLKKIPDTKTIRLWDAGDCPGNKTELDQKRCVKLADALRGRTGSQFGYTHYDMQLTHNRKVLRQMLRRGVIINVSTLPNNVDRVAKWNLPVAVVVPEPTHQTPGGMKITMCPNQMAKATGKSPVKCENCMKCVKWPRDYAIGFLPHGTGKRKVYSIANTALLTVLSKQRRLNAKTNNKNQVAQKTRISINK